MVGGQRRAGRAEIGRAPFGRRFEFADGQRMRIAQRESVSGSMDTYFAIP